MNAPKYSSMVPQLLDLIERAGQEILAVYSRDFEVRDKSDASPVTDADERAEAVIIDGLARIAPDIPVIAEESVEAGKIPDISGQLFWLVDPLDGTKEFVSRNGEFTVNIALVENGIPVLGIVHLPALNDTYWTDGKGRALRKRESKPAEVIVCRNAPEGLVVVASRSHRDSKTDDFLADFNVAELISAGSSLKLCRVAEGEADMYPRMGRTMEWDIAAGHAVLLAAGGTVDTVDGPPLRYGKPGFDNPHFVARGLQ